MKKIPVDQSRRNAARRRRRVATRQRLAGRWTEQPAPMQKHATQPASTNVVYTIDVLDPT